MISHEHQAIFIHIPKAAGTSIEKKLGLYEHPVRGDQDHRTVRGVRPLSLLRHGAYLRDAAPIRAEWMSRKTMLKEMLGLPVAPSHHGPRATRGQWQAYYKFTVVRNPWARVHSWYQNVSRDPLHGVPPCTFPEFLRDHGDHWALRPQTHWITDFDGSVPLDRIVRFETLADEMAEVLARLGFDDPTLPHLLKGAHPSDHRAAYDDATAALVAQRYADEIRRFGYTF